MIKYISKTLLAFIILSAVLLISCQKEIDIDPDNPLPIPDGVVDSTLLVKSIRVNFIDPVTGLPEGDTIKEYYFYDTASRKIILTLDQEASSHYFTGAGVEHSYDGNGLLTKVIYKYREGFIPNDDDRISVQLEYDSDKVIKKITLFYFNGDVRSVAFRKSLLSEGKYRLDWGEPTDIYIPGGQDTVSVSAVFDKTGKCLTHAYSYGYNTVYGGGEDTYTMQIFRDTLVYDELGSVVKVIKNFVDTLKHINETIVGCEFSSRHNKGNQLFNLRQVLLNGIAGIRFGDEMFHGSITGTLSFVPGGYEPMQYHMYPFKSARVYNTWTKEFSDFTAISEFDNRDRLVKFRGFSADDMFPYVYGITYYK